MTGAAGEFLGTIENLEEYLAVSAVESRSSEDVVAEFARRARKGGISIGRMMVGWRLLDPLFLSRIVTWERDIGTLVNQFRHGQPSSPDYVGSPINAILTSGEDELRCRIDGTNEPFRFAVLAELQASGLTDYIIFRLRFGSHVSDDGPGAGVVMSFVSERPGGFTDPELTALRRLRYMIALNARTAMEAQMRRTLASTYLGRSAGDRVLGGEVARGGGEAIEAVIWYCDLRGSTALCEAMGMDAYLPFLNDYFSAIAEPVVAEGGEILDFMGDAVLAIFPLGAEGTMERVRRSTDVALARLDDFRTSHDVLHSREKVADVAGIAIDTGTVVYGNIGIPTRLTFSVIGPTVNKVTRIEAMTKTLREPVLVSRSVAKGMPELWRSCGSFHLAGVAGETELFALVTEARKSVAA